MSLVHDGGPDLGNVTDTIYAGGPVACTAQSDAHSPYTTAIANTPETVLPYHELGGNTLAPGTYFVAGVLSPSILLKFRAILTNFRLAYTRFIYSSWDIHLIFGVSPLRYYNSFATIMHFVNQSI